MYSFIIFLYALAVYIAAFFGHKKARKMVRGQMKTWHKLKYRIDKNEKYIWFHAASLGEFEQGRPLIERIKKEHPEKKILLTFFSPSGYEVRKDYPYADVVCYLPFDTKIASKSFLHYVKLEKVFFIKYEFWRNYITQLKRKNVPIYSVSSIFRRKQIFFRWYGWWYKYMLRRFTHFFVQDERSKELLATLGVNQVTVMGDTRFDRVIDIMKASKELPLVDKFTYRAENQKKNQTDIEKYDDKFPVLVFGSTWPVDEEFIIPYFNRNFRMKMVLAPHVVSEEHLQQIEQKLTRPSVRYTKASKEEIDKAECLIIDCYGLLSSVYRYATVAYVGGGFGVGIHNVPEAAVYGIPVIIGPNNEKFREAQQLLEIGGCKEVNNAREFEKLLDTFFAHPELKKRAGEAAGNYIMDHAGAAEKIYRFVFQSEEEKD